MFTWIPIYTELAEKILAYRDRQNELLSMIRDLKNQGQKPIGTEDKDNQNKPIALVEIDPFTFFANFNRGRFKKDSRCKMLELFKEKFHLLSGASRRLRWNSRRSLPSGRGSSLMPANVNQMIFRASGIWQKLPSPARPRSSIQKSSTAVSKLKLLGQPS